MSHASGAENRHRRQHQTTEPAMTSGSRTRVNKACVLKGQHVSFQLRDSAFGVQADQCNG